jgi:DNA-binding GntR family transcriptional regulator
MTFSPVRSMTLRDQVIEQIRTAIIEGRLRPGDHIVEASITEQMQVSRTPVREALILLEQQSLVVSYPNRGYFVQAFTEEDVREIFSMRASLENFAAELNIDRFTEDDYLTLEGMITRQKAAIETGDSKHVRGIDMGFHRYIVSFSGHSRLLRSWSELVAQVAALLHLRAEGFEYDEMRAAEDHMLIVDGYRARDLEAVRRHNNAINARVSGECQRAIQVLGARTKTG